MEEEKNIGSSVYPSLILHMLVSLNLMFVRAKHIKSNTVDLKDLGYCAAASFEKINDILYATFLSVPDFPFVALHCGLGQHLHASHTAQAQAFFSILFFIFYHLFNSLPIVPAEYVYLPCWMFSHYQPFPALEPQVQHFPGLYLHKEWKKTPNLKIAYNWKLLHNFIVFIIAP